MKNLICTLAILILTFNLSQAQSTRQSGIKKDNKESSSHLQPAAAGNPVTGSGTAGRLAKWTGVDGSNTFTLGNTNIFEDKFGKVGIGATAPTSTLTVQGMIETTLGGYKFPDGTVQTTAGLASVFRNATLTGNGTAASPLGIAIPLNLTGSAAGEANAILRVENTGAAGVGLSALGGASGTGMQAQGGVNPTSGPGGVGLVAQGGVGNNSFGGTGVVAGGGNATLSGGLGIFVFGGSSFGSGPGGQGVVARGGEGAGSIGTGGDGVVATGGTGAGEGDSGAGVKATGGTTSSDSKPGDGVVATGGNYFGPNSAVSGGAGVVAAGGNGKFGGSGVEATGGTGGPNTPGGTGVFGTGGNASGSVSGGAGVRGVGGTSPAGLGGTGVSAGGAAGELLGGFGLDASGGRSNGGDAGAGIRSFGGGGGFPGGATGNGGDGVLAVGGEAHGAGKSGGDGIVARGGKGLDGATGGRAGIFNGDVQIEGALNVTGTKNFKIDHPLDPENKYLSHAAIESSEVLNVYSGNVKTNKKGEAIVTLPEWFESLNKDLRYQLTVIGRFAQAIVAEKVKQNRFRVRTSTPNTEVSWQVIGVRSDAAMLKRPFKPEEEKPERERGTYLNPEAYGQPEERGSERARHPEVMQRLTQQPLEAQQAQQKQGRSNNR